MTSQKKPVKTRQKLRKIAQINNELQGTDDDTANNYYDDIEILTSFDVFRDPDTISIHTKRASSETYLLQTCPEDVIVDNDIDEDALLMTTDEEDCNDEKKDEAEMILRNYYNKKKYH